MCSYLLKYKLHRTYSNKIDHQACRNEYDLKFVKIPKKFEAMGDFWRYYSGAATAPCLTIVIGGNHEASNHMWEL